MPYDPYLLADLNAPGITARGREPMHATWTASASAADALTGTPSPWSLSLDGTWRFQLADDPGSVAAGSELEGFDDRSWHDLPVPANWELHGHGKAIYQNCTYPFPVTYPAPPAANPTGCYRRGFDLPAAWDGRRVFLEFGAVDSSFHCWVNGRLIGYATDSKLPSAFDITAALRPGRNTLAVRVYRWGVSAYLEKQDYWHLSGIQRSVRLIAKPQRHLHDWCVRTRRGDDGVALAEVRAWINQAPALWDHNLGCARRTDLAGWRVRMCILHPDGTILGSSEAAVADASRMYGQFPMGMHEEAFTAVAAIRIPGAPRWTAETPALCRLVLELVDPSGAAVDWETCRFGVRSVAISDGVLRLDGQRLVIRGVNRHDFHPEHGRAVTVADVREDLLAMKRLGINAIRTCHYPSCEALYDLADELGLYVVDEANLETHGLNAVPTRDPAWAQAFVERAARMVLRDRNHPCIIAWSLGNESHVGPNHAAMAGWIRMADPTRPVQYESGNPGPAITDILVPMYPTLAWVRQVLADPAERRPLIMCEYAYAKGNSTGNFAKFWSLVWELERFQGGFIWDWRDKALQLDGRLRYGAIGDEPLGTERMCLNGIVGAGMNLHPGALEVAHHYAPVDAVAVDAARGLVRLINRHQFLDLSGFRLRWSVVHGGRSVVQGVQPCPALAPGAEATIAIPMPATMAEPGALAAINLVVERMAATPWADAGAAVMERQLVLARPQAQPTAPVAGRVRIDGGRVVGDGFACTMDPAIGGISAWTQGGTELLAQPIVPCLWRAPTDIDRAVGAQGFWHDWRACGLDRARWMPGPSTMTVAEDGSAEITLHGVVAAPELPPVAQVVQRWRITADGTAACTLEVQILPVVPTVPRIGLRGSLRGAGHRLSWIGHGPHENYPDRLDSAGFGHWSAPVADLMTPYLFPQECGLRCGVASAVIAGGGPGLLLAGDAPCAVSALPVRLEDLERAEHRDDLRLRDETAFHLDGFHMGLGGDNGWARNVHPEFLLPPGSYRCTLRLRMA